MNTVASSPDATISRRSFPRKKETRSTGLLHWAGPKAWSAACGMATWRKHSV